jgi:hypothetical protein
VVLYDLFFEEVCYFTWENLLKRFLAMFMKEQSQGIEGEVESRELNHPVE